MQDIDTTIAVPLAPGMRCRVLPARGTALRAGPGAGQAAIRRLDAGTPVLIAELAEDDRGGQSARLASPAGWVDARDLDPLGPAATLRLDYPTFVERHLRRAAGDRYGLCFPFTLEQLGEAGPAFLTEAFRASGAIAADNRVTAIEMLKPLGIPGASENALLTVAYARAEPGLSTELFVKVPPADLAHKFRLSSHSEGEVVMSRLSRERDLPVAIPTCYFGDYCTETTNYLLITERIAFGQGGIEPAHRKGYDHQVPDIAEHYRVLAAAQARLVAAHKAGALGDDIEAILPFPRAARNFDPIPDAADRIARLVHFVGTTAPHLFLAEAREPAFLARWAEDLAFGLEHKNAVIAALHADVDYTGLCHPNLNIDNAWFWRDEGGALHAGLLDWGGAGQLSIAQALSGMMMMPEPERHIDLVELVLDTFVAGLAAAGGPALDRGRLLLQYKASLYSTAIWTIVEMLVDHLTLFSDEDWRAMASCRDPRLLDSGFCTVVIWIDNILREWHHGPNPADACRALMAD